MVDDLPYQQARKSRDARFDGKFFVAVKSTGIFCRPICPAPSPKEENVEYYDLAQQAMQAGYRPCLRCRPDSAPNSYAWKGVDTTVERSIKLLRQYPDMSLTDIADKLGITDRYLRTLFNQKLGMSPKKFQLFEQLLFAKQLLHQSNLTVEQVAQSSGFSSSRRLQDNLKNSTGLTPKQIRQGRTAREKILTLQLFYRPPYAWEQVRAFLAFRAVPGMEEVQENSYSRTFNLKNAKGWFSAIHHPEDRMFEVKLQLDSLSEIKGVVTEIRRILDLDADPQAIDEGLNRAGVSSNDRVDGIRIPGIWSPFEAGCRAILGQQISVKAAINLLSVLVEQLGVKQEQKVFFPTPDQVSASDLTFLKMPHKRRETLQAFARYCAANPDEEDLNNWLSIKGIGPWTVAYALMRGASYPDVWLDTDLVIKKQLAEHSVDPKLCQPWRSYLTFQLWSMA